MSKFFAQQGGVFSQQNQQKSQQQQPHVITKIASPSTSVGYSSNLIKTIKLEPGTSHHNHHQKINSHLLDHGYGATPHYANMREVNRMPPKASEVCITNYYKVRLPHPILP